MNELFDMLKKSILTRAGSSIIGLITLCGLLWFISPKLGIVHLAWRITLIAAVIFTALLIFIGKRWYVQHKGHILEQHLQSQRENVAGRQLEISLLREKMAEAVHALRTSELAVQYRGSAALYALPWFMVIGPAAVGKSTLLRQSGLHFSLASEEEIRIRGFGGTRHCDWWFADEAILLDTAGRYTTNEDDHEEWSVFLQMIKKYRPRLPINGILVVLSIADLLTADEEGLRWHVKVIRERIAEMTQQLGYLFPIYIVFTKIDLLQGFNDFFQQLSEENQRQVLGVHLADLTSHAEKAAYSKTHLFKLYENFTQWRLPSLAQQADITGKFNLLDFPQQFLAATECLNKFIQLLFKENPYQETPNFAGIYFTSAAQASTTIQQISSSPTTTFAYTEAPAVEENLAGKGYFIKQLFNQVIFPYRDMAYKSRQRMWALRGLKSVGVIGGLMACVGAAVLYSTSLTANTLLLHEGVNDADQASSVLMQSALTPQEKLQSLHQLYQYIFLLQTYRQNIPWHLRLGLYRGNQLLPTLSMILLQGLHTYFFSPVGSATEQQLMHLQESWALATPTQQQAMRGDYYTLLKVYLMLGNPQHMDVDLAGPVLTQLWSKPTDLSPAFLQGMVNFYLLNTQHRVWPIKSDLVQLSRQQLYLPADINNLYAALRSKGLHELGSISAATLVGGENGHWLMSDNLLPILFTVRGWHHFAQPEIQKIVHNAAKGDWVMGPFQPHVNPDQAEQLAQQLQTLYFNDYSNAWLQFLSGLHLQPFASLDDAAKQLTLMANHQGPIAQLLAVTDQNLTLNNAVLQNTFQQALPLLTPGKNLVTSDAVDTYLQQMGKLKSFMESLVVSADAQRDAQNYAAQLLSGAGSQTQLYQASIKVNLLTNNISPPEVRAVIQHVLLMPVQEAWRALLHQATIGLAQQWQAQVVPVYQQGLANKFPFAASESDADSEDINRFFHPQQGVLWQFINQNLLPYLQATPTGWKTRTWLGIGVNFTSGFLHWLNQAKTISEGFFSAGSDSPQFHFEIYPVPTAGLREIALTTNGQTYRYRNEPQEWQKITWPGHAPNETTVLTLVTANEASQGNIEIDSVWGFFRLLQKARLVPANDNVLHATWSIKADNGQHYRVTLFIRNDGSANLFSHLLLNQFVLPATLFGSN